MSGTFTVKFIYKGKTAFSDNFSYSTTASELLDEARKNFKVKSGVILHIICKGKKIAFEELDGDDIVTYAHPAFDDSMDLTLGCTVTVVGTNPTKQKLKPKRETNKFCDDGISGVYDGELDARGLRHGKGEITCEDGEVYNGEWKQDVRDGQGACRMSNGAVYEGQFKRNKREGHGTYYCTNGDKYVGGYRAHLRDGNGTYHRSNGDKFVGRYKAGSPNGVGTYYRKKDGSVDVGRYKGENSVVTAIGEGVRWSKDRSMAWSLQNGKEVKEISLTEARETASQMGSTNVPP